MRVSCLLLLVPFGRVAQLINSIVKLKCNLWSKSLAYIWMMLLKLPKGHTKSWITLKRAIIIRTACHLILHSSRKEERSKTSPFLLGLVEKQTNHLSCQEDKELFRSSSWRLVLQQLLNFSSKKRRSSRRLEPQILKMQRGWEGTCQWNKLHSLVTVMQKVLIRRTW